MKIEIFSDADAVARKGAEIIAAEARAAVKACGSFIVAVSGGHTPWQMLRGPGRRRGPVEERAGKDKVSALARLRNGDPTIPAGRIQRDNALVLADQAAAGPL